MDTKIDSRAFKSGYSEVNKLKMYYEIYGEGKPLVLIHGGGSTIQTTFGRVIPILAKHRQLIAASALFKRDGVPSQFWGFMEQARLENMPEQLKEGYKKVASDPSGLQIMHDKDAKYCYW